MLAYCGGTSRVWRLAGSQKNKNIGGALWPDDTGCAIETQSPESVSVETQKRKLSAMGLFSHFLNR